MAEAAGAFKFSRPEDVATNPDDATEAVMASTGVASYVGGADQRFADQHALVDHLAGGDEEDAAVLEGEQRADVVPAELGGNRGDPAGALHERGVDRDTRQRLEGGQHVRGHPLVRRDLHEIAHVPVHDPPVVVGTPDLQRHDGVQNHGADAVRVFLDVGLAENRTVGDTPDVPLFEAQRPAQRPDVTRVLDGAVPGEVDAGRFRAPGAFDGAARGCPEVLFEGRGVVYGRVEGGVKRTEIGGVADAALLENVQVAVFADAVILETLDIALGDGAGPVRCFADRGDDLLPQPDFRQQQHGMQQAANTGFRVICRQA